jgi:acyl-CoA dehydrogenase
LLNYGSEEQKRNYLPRMARGQLVAAIAMTEPGAGSDLQGIRTRAEKRGGDYVINGQKTFISNGYLAGIVLVVVKTDPSQRAAGTSIMIVETENCPGYRVGRLLDKIGLKAQDTSELFFDDVRVPAENLLGGTEGQGFYQLMKDLPYERTMIGVGGVAAMEGAYHETLTYVRERKAFGRAIAEFQNTQFQLAEVATQIKVARTFVDYCVERLIAGELDAPTAAMLKLHVSETQGKVIDQCLQLFGGYGYMTEYMIARMYTDARIQRIYGGTNEIMKTVIGRAL